MPDYMVDVECVGERRGEKWDRSRHGRRKRVSQRRRQAECKTSGLVLRSWCYLGA